MKYSYYLEIFVLLLYFDALEQMVGSGHMLFFREILRGTIFTVFCLEIGR